MKSNHLLQPRLIIVDDESHVRAALRLRVGRECEVSEAKNADEALALIKSVQFDLCLVDISMPGMSGFGLIELARKLDPGLGYVIVSGHSTNETYKQAIPLQVYDFVDKPISERFNFEGRIIEWINLTRVRRREMELATRAEMLSQDVEQARMEREVELVASESARDALLQSANLLTTLQALLVSSSLSSPLRTDPALTHLARTIAEARKTADAAVMVVEGFFNSAYANREASPALLKAGLQHAASIALRWAGAEASQKQIHFVEPWSEALLKGINGIDFLLMVIPPLGTALQTAPDGSSVSVEVSTLNRIDEAPQRIALRDYIWLNKKYAASSNPAILLKISGLGPPLDPKVVRSWLKGDDDRVLKIPSRGLVTGLQKSHGLCGIAVSPLARRFELVLALPI